MRGGGGGGGKGSQGHGIEGKETERKRRGNRRVGGRAVKGERAKKGAQRRQKRKRRRKRGGKQGGREDRGQDRQVCGQLGAQRPGGESMGRRRPLRGRAVHWAAFPLKLAPCFSHKKTRLRLIPPTQREPPPEIQPITETEKRNAAIKHFALGKSKIRLLVDQLENNTLIT